MHTDVIETRMLTKQPTAVRTATLTPAEMVGWFSATFGEVAEYLRRRGTRATGFPFARCHPMPGGRFEVEAGFPVAARVISNGMAQASSLPSGPVAVTMYVGSYDKIGATYESMAEWLRLKGATPAGDAWEIYHNPPIGDPDTWRTEIVQPYHPGRS